MRINSRVEKAIKVIPVDGMLQEELPWEDRETFTPFSSEHLLSRLGIRIDVELSRSCHIPLSIPAST